jgi:hypothetical protein
VHLRRLSALFGVLLIGAGCSEGPTAPEEQAAPPDPELSVITPLLLPPGADWGLYFVSFNRTRTLHARAIHYPDGSARGTGSFTVAGGPSGFLRITSAEPYGDCLPTGSPCGTVTDVPESAVTRGTATLLNGRGGWPSRWIYTRISGRSRAPSILPRSACATPHPAAGPTRSTGSSTTSRSRG